MRRLALAGALVAGAFLSAPAATACTVDTCWFTQPVCSRVTFCHVCYYEPQGARECLL